MKLTNSPIDRLVLKLERSKSFSLALRFRDQNDRPINLTGAVLHLDVAAPTLRPNEVPVRVIEVVAAIPGPLAGYARFDLQADDLHLTAKTYDFVMTLVTSGGYSAVVAKGDLELLANPSADVTNSYVSTNPVTALDIQLLSQAEAKLTLGSVLPPNAGYLSDADKAKLDILAIVADELVVDLSDYATTAAMTAGDAATLAAADSAADLGDAGTYSAATLYADSGDAAALATAQGYADGVAAAEAAAALAAANAYTNGREAALVALMALVLPVGALLEYGGSTAPSGFLMADGSSKLVSAYPALFAVYGYTYGGSGLNFNLPDKRKRVGVGYDSTDSDFNALGKTGGAKTHTLTGPQSGIAQHTHLQNSHNHTQDRHNHTQTAHNHSRGVTFYGGTPANPGVNLSGNPIESIFYTNGGTGYTNDGAGTSFTAAVNRAATATNQAATAVNQNAGPTNAAEAHNNMQPFIALNYIIKI
jgi:microcystin-dependent protein